MRCKHNRVLAAGGKLWDAVMKQPPLGCVRFEMPAGRGRKACSVKQELRAQRVSPPDGRGGFVQAGHRVWLVQANGAGLARLRGLRSRSWTQH